MRDHRYSLRDMKLIFFVSIFIYFISFSILSTSVSLADISTHPPASIRLYGFLLPSFIFGTREVESFSRANSVAYTAAANPVLATHPQHETLAIQLEQTRFGFAIGEGNKTSALIEFDFVDTSKSQAWVNSYPRLRRALVDFEWDESNHVQFGQDWDLFSPLAPHTYNLVGHYFETGDVGFMRQQLAWINKSIPHLELAGALGMQTSNTTLQFSNKELSLTPTISLRATMIDGANQFGLSVLASSLLTDIDAKSRLFAGGVNAFIEHQFGDFTLRSECYLGKNLYNLGTQALSFGEKGHDVAEWGAWATGLFHISSSLGVFGGAGISKIINPGQMLASYTRDQTTRVTSLGSYGPGIEQNYTLRMGTEYALTTQLKTYIEAAYLNTLHHLHGDDKSQFNPRREALVTQTGLMYTF
ncbi:hypothetical protein EBS43_07190 [bacterium]|jgi:hypothetical protein|nr:hypothetical protein [bacterium]